MMDDDSNKQTVLVIEDDDDVRLLTAVFLESAGYHVRTARNGEVALALLERRAGLPDVIVLDVEMPVLDGPSTAARLFVQNAGRERIPIVLVSGAVELPAIARRIGTTYKLSKPFDPSVLVAIVDRAATERRGPRPAV